MAYNREILFEKYLQKRKAGAEFEQITNELTILGISDLEQDVLVNRIKAELGKLEKKAQKKNGLSSVIFGSAIFIISLAFSRLLRAEPFYHNLFVGMMLVGTVFIVNGFRNR